MLAVVIDLSTKLVLLSCDRQTSISNKRVWFPCAKQGHAVFMCQTGDDVWRYVQVIDLQQNLKQEQIIVEEKKMTTQALIESIGQEKAVVDQAVEAGREDEEQAAKLQVGVTHYQAPGGRYIVPCCRKWGFHTSSLLLQQAHA